MLGFLLQRGVIYLENSLSTAIRVEISFLPLPEDKSTAISEQPLPKENVSKLQGCPQSSCSPPSGQHTRSNYKSLISVKHQRFHLHSLKDAYLWIFFLFNSWLKTHFAVGKR